MESDPLCEKYTPEVVVKKNGRSFFSSALFYIEYVRKLNIDIPAGVLCSALFASKLFNVYPPFIYFFVLFSAVWIIYSTDHVIDGFRSRNKAFQSHYGYHYKNRSVFIPLIIILALICGVLSLTFLEPGLIIFGSGMMFVVAIYLVLNAFPKASSLLWMKELLIAAIYTLGVFGGIIVLKGYITVFQCLIIINFLLIVYSNVLLFALFETKKDENLGFNNFALSFGIKMTRSILFIVLTLSLLLSALTGLYFQQWHFIGILQLMTLSVIVIFYKQAYFRNSNTYGIVTDAIFFLPLLAYWI